MKRLLFLLVLIFSVLIFPAVSFAQNNFNSGNNVVLSSDQTINRDYFASGSDILVNGTVNGDAYFAGGNTTINGKINGDLLSVGGNININGEVAGSIRAAGGNIIINGKIGRNVSIAGGSINIHPSSEIAGSMTAAGGNINVLGPIGKDVNIAGGQVNIDNSVGGDIAAGIGQLTLSPNAKVDGNINYWSNNKASLSSQSTVSGKITQHIPPQRQKMQTPQAAKATLAAFVAAFKIMGFLSALLIGFILIKVFPVFVSKTSNEISGNLLLTLAVGFIALAATPFLFILLLATVIGIPIAFLYVIAVVFDLWFAKIFVSLAIGLYTSKRVEHKWNMHLALFLGLLIYYIIGIIPVIGWLFDLLAGLAGFGAIILTKKNIFTDLSKKKLI